VGWVKIMLILSILASYLLVVSAIVFFSNRRIEKRILPNKFYVDPDCKGVNSVLPSDYFICSEELSKRELMERYNGMS